ncbi:serine/threonine-protein kinase [Roseateles sp. BYS180W]|uniref:Serine/threonine-protein kinase n=1 Tax=Roseateles rivi TaxID=3299028 RepID=A0ABW7FTR5_9BURK
MPTQPYERDDSPTAPGLPARVGRYRLVRRLGEGATSEVFLARDEFRQIDVAVKRLRDWNALSAAEQGLVRRFFASEAALSGRFKHPNVVQILDAIDDEDAPYLVMEYVPGVTLRRFCRPDQLLPLEQIVELGFKCAMALSYVAGQGVIHRDIKPANLLGVMDAQGRLVDVKVTDFGSALHLHAETTQVQRVGSLSYMPPEQIDGGSLDTRADMYALAAVLYHLVAGRPPFEAEHQAALLHQIYHRAPPPLVGARADVSPALQSVIFRALAKHPADRYPDWEAFAQALSALVTQQQVPLAPLQEVRDSERFTLLRSLEFFADFGDIALWEVVHRARWQRFPAGHCLYRTGQTGNSFHIIALGGVEVWRDGQCVARLAAGTSVGEMAYLAPNPELRLHSTDVRITEQTTTLSFTPDTLAQLSPECRHAFDRAFIQVLVRRLHAAHEALAHPRRIL